MHLNIHALGIADGLKDALIRADFTIESILKHESGEIASIMRIDPYVAEIVVNAAKKAAKCNGSTRKKYYHNNVKSFELINNL
jgi:hypothetical protein